MNGYASAQFTCDRVINSVGFHISTFFLKNYLANLKSFSKITSSGSTFPASISGNVSHIVSPGDLDCIAGATSQNGAFVWDIKKGKVIQRFNEVRCYFLVAEQPDVYAAPDFPSAVVS